MLSCGDDDCQTCTGNVLREDSDITICDKGYGTWTSTDNIIGFTTTDTTEFQFEIALAETCDYI